MVRLLTCIANMLSMTSFWLQCVPTMLDYCAGDLVVLIKEGVSAITDSILGSMDIPVEAAEEATTAAAVE